MCGPGMSPSRLHHGSTTLAIQQHITPNEPVRIPRLTDVSTQAECNRVACQGPYVCYRDLDTLLGSKALQVTPTSRTMDNRNACKSAQTNARRNPKSRNGCIRCKAKRLKCDEDKPECHQCKRKNLACPGYRTKELIWSTKHEKISVPSQKPDSTHSSSLSSLLHVKASPAPSGDEEQFDSSVRQETPSTAGTSISSSQSQISAATLNSTQHYRSDSDSMIMRRGSNHFPDSLSAIRHQLESSSVPQFMQHLPTMLVEHYFNYVCQIFSSFDGTLNPFRSTVGRLWDGSAPIYYAIQSMAAAYLSNHFPRMGIVGIEMQREYDTVPFCLLPGLNSKHFDHDRLTWTYKCLYQATSDLDSDDLDRRLLSVLLVGQTTAWHNPKDLGLAHLRTAKRLNRRRIERQSKTEDSRVKRQNEFFDQCILYWDMLSGFVVDDVDESTSVPLPSLVNDLVLENVDSTRNVFPHPWTGVAPEVQKTFARVGKLVRTYRRAVAKDQASSLDFLPLDIGLDEFPQESIEVVEAIEKAQILEEELLSFHPPPVTNLVNTGDENTPIQQYIFLAEAYRCAGLMVLYRVFPSILINRLPNVDDIFNSASSSRFGQTSLNYSPNIPSQGPEDFLLSLALHTITLLEKLPLNSGTRCLQPLVIIIAGSELRFSPPQKDIPGQSFLFFDTKSTPSGCLTSNELDIASGRRFVKQRFQDFQLSLPAKPIVNALTLVQEIWTRMDIGLEVFWMDVMEELGLGTIFG